MTDGGSIAQPGDTQVLALLSPLPTHPRHACHLAHQIVAFPPMWHDTPFPQGPFVVTRLRAPRRGNGRVKDPPAPNNPTHHRAGAQGSCATANSLRSAAQSVRENQPRELGLFQSAKPPPIGWSGTPPKLAV